MATHVNEDGRRLKCSAKITCRYRTNSHYPDILSSCEKEGELIGREKVLLKIEKLKDEGFSEFNISRYLDSYYSFDENGDYMDNLEILSGNKEEQMRIVSENHPDSPHVAMLRGSRFYEVKIAASDKSGYEIGFAKERFDNEIKGKEFLLTGDNAGEILESRYGYSAGNSAAADLGGVELKTHVEGGSRRAVTLSNIGFEGGEAMRDSPFITFRGNSKTYSRKLKINDWVDMGGGYKVALYPDDKPNEDGSQKSNEEKKIRMIVAHDGKILDGYEECSWSYASLFRRVDSKLKSVLIAKYSKKKRDGKDYVTFTRCKTGGFSRERFIKEIKRGNIEIELKVIRGLDKEGNERLQTKANFTCREQVLLDE